MDKKKDEVSLSLAAEELRLVIARYESVSISRVLDFYTETRCARNAKNLKAMFDKEVGAQMDLCNDRMQQVIEETRKEVFAESYKGEAAGIEINRRISLNPQTHQIQDEQKKILKTKIDFIFERLIIKTEITDRTDENGDEIFNKLWPEKKNVEISGNSAETDPYDCFMKLLIGDYFILEEDVVEKKLGSRKAQ